MEMSSDLIKDNHHLLKTCIYYEVLKKKPIFDSYRNFCRIVGKDAMEYPDFEFWYYRFYHGNREYDYDRSVDPKPKTIMDMPVKLMYKIAENLDPVERTRLRSMNHTIKAIADSFPSVFENIYITVSHNYLNWRLNDKRFSCYKNASGCTLFKPNCSKAEESEECYIKKGMEYLVPVLRMPNLQVDYFSFSNLKERLNCNDFLPVSINAKRVHIYGENVNQVVRFLSAMAPGRLESIDLDVPFVGHWESFRTIFGTDQFKKAESMHLGTTEPFNVGDLVNFSHLKKFKSWLTSDNVSQDVLRTRDILSTFEKLESCELEYHCSWDGAPIREFAEALGEEIPIGPLAQGKHRTITHRYRIPHSNDCLEFKIKEAENDKEDDEEEEEEYFFISWSCRRVPYAN
ncbi:unnamed protein product [Caenorhabditis nigoni]